MAPEVVYEAIRVGAIGGFLMGSILGLLANAVRNRSD